jgi:acetylornithine deacetylase
MTTSPMPPRQMIERLVAFDTTSRESNLALIHFVRDYLASHGIASTLVHDKAAPKANLFATVGPERDGGVVLSGHTDVVPVDGQDWSSDPFRIDERDGRLYGRGSADMKSFIAVALALVPEFQARRLKWPIHLALSYDEETGCFGVHGLLRHLEGMTTRPRAVIVGEPTSMTVVNAHKGSSSVDTVVRGLEAHSSAPQIGLNSIHYAARFVARLAALAEERRENGPFNPRFEPPYTTFGVNLIGGGTARNIVPRETVLKWDIRAIPGDKPQEIVARMDEFARAELLPEMRRRHPAAEVRSEIVNDVRALMPEDGSDAEALVLALIGSNQTFAVSYGTEGGLYQSIGLPTVICGPGDILQAHKADEWISLEQVELCVRFMRRLAERLAQAA